MKPTGRAVAAAAMALAQSYHSYKDMDCQALVERAVRNAGGSMDYRGSNHMARSVAWLGTIENAQAEGKLKPGALLFIHEEDESGLPAQYQGDGLGDFSHVGLYVGENALTDTDKHGKRRKCDVVHSSQSMGRVCGSTLKNGWTHVGLAKEIDCGIEVHDGVALSQEIAQAETDGKTSETFKASETSDISEKAEGLTAGDAAEKQPEYAVVRTPNGRPVKLRKSPSQQEDIYWLVANNARVRVERRKEDWALVQAICTDGYARRAYIMSAFLLFEGSEGEAG